MTLEQWPVPDAWRPAISGYLAHLRAAGTPATTLATRRQHLAHLARAFGGSPADVDGPALVAWTAAQQWARETRRGRRSSFRSFWSWALEHGVTTTDAAAALPVVRPAAPAPKPLPAEPLRIAVMTSDRRVALILRLAAEVGMRRAEIAQAHSRDLVPDLVGWSLVVHGKGGRDRTVPITDELAHELRALGEGYFFPGRVDGHLSARYVGKLAADALPGAWTLHSGRHRFATLAHRASGDLLVVQDLLGHASPVTTRAYVAPDSTRARAVVEALPRAA